MAARGRILVATFGSAGDLFPLIPLIGGLRLDGFDVRAAAPRGLGLYLRALGWPCIALGDGSEMGVVDDPEIFTTARAGWKSWELTFDRYLAPNIPNDVARLTRSFEGWRPDLVVATSFAVAARIAARLADLPTLHLSMYPEHRHLDGASELAPSYRTTVRATLGREPDGPILWGQPADVLLHDRALLGSIAGPAPIGFPYWDAAGGDPSDIAVVERLMAAPEPPVLVTLGSFVGLGRQTAWLDAVTAVRRAGRSALLVGPRGRWADERFGGQPDVTTVGFVPLHDAYADAAAVIHHGGLGTTFGALRVGAPAAVLPQAFDQPDNARLIDAAGVGADASTRSLDAALHSVLTDPDLRARAERTARLLPGAGEVVDRFRRAIEGHLR